MLFNTLTYLLFLPMVFALYWAARGVKAQNWVVLLVSMVFYGWWSVPCLGLMVGTCLLNYLFIHQMQRARKRKVWMMLSLMLNFGVLGVFKYFNFFADNLAALMSLWGLHADMPTLHIILPVGISFYTFQLSAYVIDCYRREIEPTRSILQFLTFICFFPQLVAGPIERGKNLLPQFSSQRRFDHTQATEGLRLILWGLVKKMLIADNCAAQVDYIFSNYATLSLPTLWLGALYFTFQIYGDFSGYSDMAVGSAKLFGINISQNFNKPYFATVFLLSGLWHGSNWTFVLWGAYHALVYKLPVKYITFIAVLIGWVFFRAEDVGMAWGYLSHMFNPNWMAAPECSKMPLLLIALLVITEWLMKEATHPFQWKNQGWQSSQWIRMACYLIVFFATIMLGGEKVQFIYFQF